MESGTLARRFFPVLEELMQRYRGFYRFHRRWILCSLALAAPLLASACAPGSASRLSGVGCADPSCYEEMPETRKVLGCIGNACNESPQPGAVEKVADPAGEERATSSPPVAASRTDSPAPQEAEEDEEGSSLWDLKVHYESFERP